MRREWLLSFGAVVLVAVGSQHHNLMMLLFAFGLSDAAMGAITAVSLVRNAILALSVLMAAALAYQISRPGRPLITRFAGALSILLTLGIAGWSVLRFGL